MKLKNDFDSASKHVHAFNAIYYVEKGVRWTPLLSIFIAAKVLN